MKRQVIIGAAGTGKTYQLRKMVEKFPKSAILCATTGIAAVNLGTNTLNSTLRYFDTASLRFAFKTGQLRRRLSALAKNYENLAIDEMSMLDAEQLTLIDRAASDAGIGIILTGDFCQLPPVKADWAFESVIWPSYASNIQKLEKIWRQDDPEFVAALHAVRAGNAPEAIGRLKGLNGIEWGVGVRGDYDGATIKAKNEEVNDFNALRYAALHGPEEAYESLRWGTQCKDWSNIPKTLKLKEGALVMMLANSDTYVNGDLGHVVGLHEGQVSVRLNRNGCEVNVCKCYRSNFTETDPKDGSEPNERGQWEIGGITYLPVRLAWATTVHKSQGLTLDKIQIDIRNQFFGAPNMAYVALSRCRTASGLRIVGTPEVLLRRIKVAEEVIPWI